MQEETVRRARKDTLADIPFHPTVHAATPQTESAVTEIGAVRIVEGGTVRISRTVAPARNVIPYDGTGLGTVLEKYAGSLYGYYDVGGDVHPGVMSDDAEAKPSHNNVAAEFHGHQTVMSVKTVPRRLIHTLLTNRHPPVPFRHIDTLLLRQYGIVERLDRRTSHILHPRVLDVERSVSRVEDVSPGHTGGGGTESDRTGDHGGVGSRQMIENQYSIQNQLRPRVTVHILLDDILNNKRLHLRIHGGIESIGNEIIKRRVQSRLSIGEFDFVPRPPAVVRSVSFGQYDIPPRGRQYDSLRGGGASRFAFDMDVSAQGDQPVQYLGGVGGRVQRTVKVDIDRRGGGGGGRSHGEHFEMTPLLDSDGTDGHGHLGAVGRYYAKSTLHHHIVQFNMVRLNRIVRHVVPRRYEYGALPVRTAALARNIGPSTVLVGRQPRARIVIHDGEPIAIVPHVGSLVGRQRGGRSRRRCGAADRRLHRNIGESYVGHFVQRIGDGGRAREESQ
mmetsp:Transcript_20542/g.59591  ORF Transcript_20542/g.59591 Transcript_20542/m.59591 type:complete len:503 (-) Transcript_20542:1535-3043(-)